MIHIFKILADRKARLLKKKKTNKGFTLMELVIVIAIFAVITSIALFNQGSLSSNVLLTNMSYEVALAIREAQVYGIGVRNSDDMTFSGEYGAHFSIDNPMSIEVYGNNYQVSDSPAYDPGEEKFHYEFENQRGNKIVALCVGDIDPTIGQRCDNSSSNPYRVNWVDILFKRPNPSPVIYTNTDAGTSETVGRVYIIVNTVDGDNCRAIIVESTGQIRVEDGRKTNPVCTNAS